MKLLHALMVCLMLGISSAGYAKDDPKEIPPKDNWGQTNDRTNGSPRLYQGESDVYVYSEKELDNLTIGITDMKCVSLRSDYRPGLYVLCRLYRIASGGCLLS